MKNRERIKSALLLSLKEKTREECKNGGLTRTKTEEFLVTKVEEFEQVAEYMLDQYDRFLINTLANELSHKLRESVEKDNKIFDTQFQNLVDTINNNHLQINNNFSSLSAYHKMVREKILEEEVLHIREDLELLKQHKKALQKIAKTESDKVSWYFVALAITSLTVWCGLIYKFGWDKMEPWTWITALGFILINALFFAFFERNLTREDLQKEKLRKSIEHIHQLYKFDEKQINRYETILSLKEEELKKLKEEKQPPTLPSNFIKLCQIYYLTANLTGDGKREV